MAGRLRTASKPSKTWIESAPYEGVVTGAGVVLSVSKISLIFLLRFVHQQRCWSIRANVPKKAVFANARDVKRRHLKPIGSHFGHGTVLYGKTFATASVFFLNSLENDRFPGAD
jgi:hypothetical protein